MEEIKKENILNKEVIESQDIKPENQEEKEVNKEEVEKEVEEFTTLLEQKRTELRILINEIEDSGLVGFANNELFTKFSEIKNGRRDFQEASFHVSPKNPNKVGLEDYITEVEFQLKRATELSKKITDFLENLPRVSEYGKKMELAKKANIESSEIEKMSNSFGGLEYLRTEGNRSEFQAGKEAFVYGGYTERDRILQAKGTIKEKLVEIKTIEIKDKMR